MVVGRASYCLSMLLYAATNFCPTIDYCRNFFAFLRFDEQTKLLVEIDRVSARTSSTLTMHRQRQYEQQPKELLFVLALATVNAGDVRAETRSISTSSLVCSS